jgi:hypothetical protein
MYCNNLEGFKLDLRNFMFGGEFQGRQLEANYFCMMVDDKVDPRLLCNSGRGACQGGRTSSTLFKKINEGITTN